MGEQARTGLGGQVQSTKCREGVFEILDHTEGVGIVAETTVRSHDLIQRSLPDMAEGWMS